MMQRESRHVIEEWLVLKAQSGDVEALTALLKRNQQPMLRHAYRLTGQADAAQDIWQETAVAVSKGISGLRDAARFHAWIFRVTTLKCRDWQRKDFRDREAMSQYQSRLVLEATTAAGKDSGDQVWAILDQLEGEDKALLSLYYIEGFSVREIARIMDLGLSAVKTRLFRARKKFRETWEGDQQ